MNTAVETTPRAQARRWEQENVTCPPANVFENENEYLLELEMPGVSKEGLEISVEGNDLTILGKPQDRPAPGEPVYRETCGGNFSRSFELSNDIDREKIRAEMKQGVLCLHLPKSERMKARKIAIA